MNARRLVQYDDIQIVKQLQKYLISQNLTIIKPL